MSTTERDDLRAYCHHCGVRVLSAGAFCSSCGEPLDDPTTGPMRHVAGAAPPRPVVPPRAGVRPDGGSDRGVVAIFGVGLALILTLIGVALYVGGVFNKANPVNGPRPATNASPSPTTPATTSGTTPTYTAPDPAQSTSTFPGRVFTIEYPTGWQIKSDEKSESWGTDTTIVSPTDSNTYLRVDVSPNTTASSPRAAAQPVISQLEKDPGYQQLDQSSETFNGTQALHWEFRVEQSGVIVHKEDVFFTAPNGDGVAVLTQAPDSEYEALRGQFAKLRKSLSFGST
jgi:hypothetical protein